MPSKVSFGKLSRAQQNRVIQKQAARAERDDRDRIRFPDDATRRNKLRNEYRRRKKEPARLERLRDEAAIPENEKNFWAQYRAACDESQPSKAEIKALLKTRGHMDIWPEVESILSAHRSWIESELRGNPNPNYEAERVAGVRKLRRYGIIDDTEHSSGPLAVPSAVVAMHDTRARKAEVERTEVERTDIKEDTYGSKTYTSMEAELELTRHKAGHKGAGAEEELEESSGDGDEELPDRTDAEADAEADDDELPD